MNSRLAKSIAAVFVAPVMAGFVTGLILGMGENSEEGQRAAMGMAMLGAIVFGIPGTLIIGLPLHALLLARRWTRWWNYAIAGGASSFLYVVGGLLILCLDADQPAICPDIFEYARSLGPLVIGSTITAVCGWLIRRPDRDRVSMGSTIPHEPAATP
jgi:hypothetical protein